MSVTLPIKYCQKPSWSSLVVGLGIGMLDVLLSFGLGRSRYGRWLGIGTFRYVGGMELGREGVGAM